MNGHTSGGREKTVVQDLDARTVLRVPLHQQVDGSIVRHAVLLVSDDVEEVVVEKIAARLQVQLTTGQEDFHAERSRAHHGVDALAGSHQVQLPQRWEEVAVDDVSNIVGERKQVQATADFRRRFIP